MARERIVAGIKYFISGVIYGVILYIIYVVLFPSLFSQLGLPIEPVSFKKMMLGFLGFFITIESFAAALRGTVYGFILKAISKLFGLLVFIYVIGSGVISGETVIEGTTVFFSLDLSPIIVAMILFTLPFILLDVLQIAREARA